MSDHERLQHIRNAPRTAINTHLARMRNQPIPRLISCPRAIVASAIYHRTFRYESTPKSRELSADDGQRILLLGDPEAGKTRALLAP